MYIKGTKQDDFMFKNVPQIVSRTLKLGRAPGTDAVFARLPGIISNVHIVLIVHFVV